jgi:hypothetical protein
MIRRACAVALLASTAVLIRPEAAWAECHEEPQVVYNQGVPVVTMVLVCEGDSSNGVESSSAEEVEVPPCLNDAIAVLLDPASFCPGTDENQPVTVTPGVVAVALQRIPLPASVLQVQPANGRTLVNFETNFFTDTAPFDRTVTLLGQQVDLHIVPSGFGWRFGDGAVLSTDDAGAPYPDLRITHTYERKGDVAPAVDTTYTATYRVNDGPWADVPGSVTIPGAPVALEVVSATPVLVGY